MCKLQKTKKATRVILILLILITALILSTNFSLAENDLLVSPDYIRISIEPEKTETRFLTIENTGDKKVDLHLEVASKESFMYIGDNDTETTIEILPGQTRAVKITISPPLGTEPDIYIAQIIYSGEGIKGMTPLVAEVMSLKRALLDVNLGMSSVYREIIKGKNVQGEITIINRGGTARIPAKITYSLKDFAGNIIISREENVMVETKLNIVRELRVPEYVRKGTYVFEIIADYNSHVGMSSRVFEVVDEKDIAAAEEEGIAAAEEEGIAAAEEEGIAADKLMSKTSDKTIIVAVVIIFALFCMVIYLCNRKVKETK